MHMQHSCMCINEVARATGLLTWATKLALFRNCDALPVASRVHRLQRQRFGRLQQAVHANMSDAVE
jgi:hypothetical protein